MKKTRWLKSKLMSDFRDLDQILSFSTKIGRNKRNEQNHKIDETNLRFTKLNASLNLPSQLFGTPADPLKLQRR
jgi:hypothetical protein